MPLKIVKFKHVFRFLEKPDSIKQNHVFFKGQYLLEEIWAQERRYFNNISHLGAQKAPVRELQDLPKRLYTGVDYLLKTQYMEKNKPGRELLFSQQKKKIFVFAIYIYLEKMQL